MEFQIITFGNGEILKGVFDAIAICLNADSGTLYQPLIRLSMILGALWAALYAIYGDYMKAITNWIIPMTVIMQLLFVPQASVWIVDPVSHYHQKVDHVPYGLALIAGRISEFGFYITQQIERVFALPDDLKYQKTGSMFASTLIQQAKVFRITNEDLAENMRQFVGHCVAYDALLGRKYTINDLRHSDDIWQLVSTNASPVRSFLWREPKAERGPRPPAEIITCREGVERFNRQWATETDKTAELFGKKFFHNNSAVNPRTEILQYLPIAYQALTNMSKSAQQILQQNMMIYAVVDGLEQKSTQLGNAPNFAARRAYLQQRSTYETLGAMASETLPTIKAVFEAIAYSAFLFVIPLAILPFGYMFLKTWFQVLLWLQMWAPLYAILNFIMTMAARSKSVAALSLSNQAGVTIASSVGLANVNADMAAMAGYLAMSIPFLCIALVKGVGSFVNLASVLSNVTQGAASQAAGDAVSGNYNLGNIIQGTRQAYNTHMLTQNTAASYRSGSFQESDGYIEVITSADGQQVINMSRSNLPVSLNVAEIQSSQSTEQAGRSYQKGLQKSQAYVENMADTYKKAFNFAEHVGNSAQSSHGFNENGTIEQSDSVNEYRQIVEKFGVDNNLTAIQASQVLGAVSAKLSGGVGISGSGNTGGKSGVETDERGSGAKMLLDLAINLDGNVSGSANLQDIYEKAKEVTSNKDFQQAVRDTMQLSHHQSFNAQDETGKRLADDTSKSWDKSNSFKAEAVKNFNESEDYRKQAEHVKTFSASVNADHLQSALEWYSKQKMDNTNGTIGMREAARIFVQEPGLRNRAIQSYLSTHGLSPSVPQQVIDSSPGRLHGSYEAENRHAFIDVSKEKTLEEIEVLKQTAKQEHQLVGSNDMELEQRYWDKKKKVQGKISEQKQSAIAAYSKAEATHAERANKNLTGLAMKKTFDHVGDAVDAAQEALTSFRNRTAEKLNLHKKSDSGLNQDYSQLSKKSEDDNA
jgi:conjugal transfer mating pair stabilization protein TraG